jgi:hypothetical protein
MLRARPYLDVSELVLEYYDLVVWLELLEK